MKETLEALTTPARPPTNGRLDEVLRVYASSLGCMKPFPGFALGSSEKSFGTPGMGGSFGHADPGARIGFAYAPTRSGYYLWDNPRGKALRKAVYRCL